MESSPLKSNAAAGVKRPASLLPAFEPLSSSPSLPRPQKRVARESEAHGGVLASKYPTPMPTSSTQILSSSPPARAGLPRPSPSARRTFSSTTLSERTPLSTVPTIMLPETGEPVKMGRSSASCQHQLAANRMISRVHVQATYKPAPNPFDRDRVEIMCTGWNGIKLHCQGKTYDLGKGKTFTSDIKDADIMIDVHDARVLVQWPRAEKKDGGVSTDSEQAERTPTRKQARRSERSPEADAGPRLVSPVSPSPAAVQGLIPPSSPVYTPSRSRNAVVVYEDEPQQGSPSHHHDATSQDDQSSERVKDLLQSSQSSELSDLSKPDDYSDDHDEENDPIVHSFGPFGENLLPRMASFSAESPVRTSRPLQPTQSAAQAKREQDSQPKPVPTGEIFDKIQNHAINQLAFSRLSSTPFSTILQNLPPTVWKADANTPPMDEIRAVIDATQCIGKVAREGKDAAGKPLESEYYYVADFDDDAMRREAVVNDLRKPGLRNCRKQHKVSLPWPVLLSLVRGQLLTSVAIFLAQAQVIVPSVWVCWLSSCRYCLLFLSAFASRIAWRGCLLSVFVPSRPHQRSCMCIVWCAVVVLDIYYCSHN